MPRPPRDPSGAAKVRPIALTPAVWEALRAKVAAEPDKYPSVGILVERLARRAGIIPHRKESS